MVDTITDDGYAIGGKVRVYEIGIGQSKYLDSAQCKNLHKIRSRNKWSEAGLNSSWGWALD